MNPRLKIKAELEEKYRRKYEEKVREMELDYDRRLRQERANFQRMLKMGLQQGDDAAIMAIDDVFDVTNTPPLNSTNATFIMSTRWLIWLWLRIVTIQIWNGPKTP